MKRVTLASGIELDTIEQFEIPQRPKHLALEHGPEVNSLLAAVAEAQH